MAVSSRSPPSRSTRSVCVCLCMCVSVERCMFQSKLYQSKEAPRERLLLLRSAVALPAAPWRSACLCRAAPA